MDPGCIRAKPSHLQYFLHEEGIPLEKDGVRSWKQECMYESSWRKRCEEYQGMVKDKVVEAEWSTLM